MRTLIILMIMAAGFAACKNGSSEQGNGSAAVAAQPGTANPVTDVHWIDSVKNIGKITEGEKVELVYRFVNTGENPLVIYNVSSSCGCTIAEKPEAPILPGKEGVIKAVFNTKGKLGTNNKFLQVYCNTQQAHYPLIFNAEVVPADAN